MVRTLLLEKSSIETSQQSRFLDEKVSYEAEIIADLNLVWQPHPAQSEVKRAIFYEGKKYTFLENGRKYGKTDILNYFLYRLAMSQPGSACYYIAPFQKQARELIWANRRLQDFFLPKVDPKTGLTACGHTKVQAHKIFEELWDKYILKVKDDEMRIIFRNNSFIKLDGSDNYEAYRGVNPHAIGYDEFKDFHPKFHDGMDPNLATHEAPIMVIGTPPDGSEKNAENFVAVAEEYKQDPRGFYQNKSTYSNPYISRSWLENKKTNLYRTGQEHKWLREYMAKRVRCGDSILFPTFEAPDLDQKVQYTSHVRPREEIRKEVMAHYKDWEHYYIFDPASASTFGGLHLAIHKYDRRIRAIQEIYEKDKKKMTSTQIMRRAVEQLSEMGILTEDVRMPYDYAAAWFYNDIVNNEEFEDCILEPCEKDIKTKKDKITMMRDAFDMGIFKVSEDCPNFISEIANYKTDENNKIIKENDHLIDCGRYGLNADHYDLDEVARENGESDRRGFSPEEDLHGYGRAI